MNIWILNHYASTPEHSGGTRHFDFARELVKKGHSVTIFASSFNHFSRIETQNYMKDQFWIKECIEDVNFIWIKTTAYTTSYQRLFNIFDFSRNLRKVLSEYFRLTTRPDLIIGSSVHPLTALEGLKFSKKNHIRFFFEERDLWPQTFLDFGLMSKRNPLYYVLLHIEKKLYKESDKVIFLFEKAKNYAIPLGLDATKIIYLPNGFSEDRSILDEKFDSEVSNKIPSYLKDKKICMYVGSMGVANHLLPILELAKAMKEQQNYHFLLIGNGPEKENLEKFAKQASLENVTFLGSVPKREIPYLLNHAHVGLISIKNSPLYKWGMSMNKIYDYLSMGLPIIMYTDLDDLGSLNKTKAIYASNELSELKNYISQVETSDEIKNEIKNVSKELFSWESLTATFLENVEEGKK